MSIGILLSGWATMMAVVGAALMVGHWVPLPTPAVGSNLPLDAVPNKTERTTWTALHFLYSDCPCSRRVLKHILQREPLKNIEETVVLVGESDGNRELPSNSKFTFDCVTPAELKSK